MSPSIHKRMERFHLELPTQDPAAWTLEMLDQARRRLLAEAEDQHFHLKTVEEAILDHPLPPPNSRITRHLMGTCVHDESYRGERGMPEAIATCYLGLARACLERNEAALAVRAIERVLQSDLAHPDALDLLKRMSDSGARSLADDLRQRFHLRHVRSIGKSRLTLPYLFLLDKQQRHLIVCDAVEQRVCVFSLSGRFLRAIDLGIANVVGVTLAKEEGFWVCDTPRRRVLRLGLSGKVLEEFRYARTPGGPELRTSARAFEIGPGRFVAAGVDEVGQDITGELGTEGFRPYPSLAGRCLYLNSVADQLMLRDHYSGELFTLDPRTGLAAPIRLDPPQSGANYGFAANADAWFAITGRNRLAKYTRDGRLVYIMPLAKAFPASSFFYDIVPATIDGREHIYISDPTSRCIHMFEV